MSSSSQAEVQGGEEVLTSPQGGPHCPIGTTQLLGLSRSSSRQALGDTDSSSARDLVPGSHVARVTDGSGHRGPERLVTLSFAHLRLRTPQTWKQDSRKRCKIYQVSSDVQRDLRSQVCGCVSSLHQQRSLRKGRLQLLALLGTSVPGHSKCRGSDLGLSGVHQERRLCGVAAVVLRAPSSGIALCVPGDLLVFSVPQWG